MGREFLFKALGPKRPHPLNLHLAAQNQRRCLKNLLSKVFVCGFAARDHRSSEALSPNPDRSSAVADASIPVDTTRTLSRRKGLYHDSATSQQVRRRRCASRDRRLPSRTRPPILHSPHASGLSMIWLRLASATNTLHGATDHPSHPLRATSLLSAESPACLATTPRLLLGPEMAHSYLCPTAGILDSVTLIRTPTPTLLTRFTPNTALPPRAIVHHVPTPTITHPTRTALLPLTHIIITHRHHHHSTRPPPYSRPSAPPEREKRPTPRLRNPPPRDGQTPPLRRQVTLMIRPRDLRPRVLGWHLHLSCLRRHARPNGIASGSDIRRSSSSNRGGRMGW